MRRPTQTGALVLALALAAAGARAAETEAVPDDQLDPMTILGTTGDPGRISGSAHRVEAEQLQEFRYDDINRVLNFVPGVYVREEDGYGLRPNIGMRGASADRSQKVTLLEDGVLIAPATYSAPAAYFFPLTARMTGVEVFKGAASIQHGPQTIGGAINLISAPVPDATAGFLNVAGGSDAYWRAHARGGSRWQDLGVLGEVIHIDTRGFKELDGGGDTGFAKNELLLKSAYRLGAGTFDVRLGYADEVSDETYLGLTETDFRASPVRRYGASALDRMEWDWTGGRLGWRGPLLGGSVQVTGYLQSFVRAWRKFNNFNGADIRDVLANPDTPFNQILVGVLRGNDTDGQAGTQDDLRVGTNARDFAASGLQGRVVWDFGSEWAHALELGARLHRDRVRRVHDEFAFEQVAGRPVANELPRTLLVDNRADTDAVAVWLRDEIRHGRWTLAPGLRVETIAATFDDYARGQTADNDYTVVLPGLGASYDVTSGLTLLAGVHRGFSPATPSLAADPEPEPEQAINYEAGGRWSGVAGRVELIAFYNDYSNLTANCTVSSGCLPSDLDTQTNAGNVEIRGVEAGWDKTLALTPTLSLPLALNYTWTEGEFQDAFSSTDPQFGDVQPGFELPYVPRHRARASAGLAHAAWSATLAAAHVSRMRDQAGAGDFAADAGADAVTVLDLAGRYEILAGLALEGRIDNLLDEAYVVSRRPYGARPGKPLSFQLGVSYRY